MNILQTWKGIWKNGKKQQLKSSREDTLGVEEAHPEAGRLPNRTMCETWITTLEILGWGSPEVPQTINIIATAVDCIPELGSKFLLKTPHTLTGGQREMRM